jgi:hypothetical protein
MRQRLFGAGIGIALIAVTAAACNTQRQLLPPTVPSAANDVNLKVSAPTPLSPLGTSTQLATRSPLLTIRESKGDYGSPIVSYEFQVQTPSGEVVYSRPSSAGPANGVNNVTHQVGVLLGANGSFRWRARAISGPDGGPWSGFNSFTTNSLSFTSSNDEFRDFFFQVIASHNTPVPSPASLLEIEPDLASVGIIEAKANDGTPRGRIYLPTGNPNSKYTRTVDVVTGFGGSNTWKWDFRGATTCEGICP